MSRCTTALLVGRPRLDDRVEHVSSSPPASVAWTDISPQSDSSGFIAVAISSDGILTAVSDGQVFYLYSLV